MTLLLLMAIAVSASAMSYTKARSQALFLTDKMGYELNLTYDQYNAVYEINLDYLMMIERQSDIYGFFWERRNSEFRYVLSSYQYQRFLASEYFYRPVTWVSGSFHFSIYNRYAKNKFFLNAPRVYDTYKGGNRQYQHSPYQGRTYGNEPDRNPRNYVGGQNNNPKPDKTKNQAIKGARQESKAASHFGTSSRQNAERNGVKK